MRILIADDHALFREGLRSLLEARGLDVVGEAADGERAVAMALEHRPDVVLMDLDMPGDLPGLGGLEATRRIADGAPDVAVVVLTASDDDHHLLDAVRLGARGYMLKDLEADRFFALLEGVARGEAAITPQLAARLLGELRRSTGTGSGRNGKNGAGGTSDDPDALTPRELQVLETMAAGVTSNRELADRLEVSENTVKFHVRNILEKLRLHDRTQAVAYALRTGLVEPDEPVR